VLVKLRFIDPGKPVQNAFVESFNGKFREECLSQNWFTSLDHARREIARWREDYNHVRPHKSLAWRTPAEAERAASSPPGRLYGRSIGRDQS
jgi:putative transposase